MDRRLATIRKIWEDAPDAQPLLRTGLRLLAGVYARWMRTRAAGYRSGRRPSTRLPCYVISVGNLSVGGTGKTPMVLYLARHLTARGVKVAILSRGYRGRLEKGGGIVSDGRKVLAGTTDSGDEPQILARALPGVPVVVGADRCRAGHLAVKAFAPDVVLLDDAFQHLKLQRDLDLVLLDCRRPLGNGYTLPAGELREPVRALERGSAAILTRCAADIGSSTAGYPDKRLAAHLNGPIFETRHVPVIREIIPAGRVEKEANPLAGRRVFAFSGVARNDEFLYTLSGFGCEVAGSMGFPDHHVYTKRDLAEICRQATGYTVDIIVTTEKDYVKIKPGTPWPTRLAVFGVEISFGGDKDRFHSFIAQRLPGACQTAI